MPRAALIYAAFLLLPACFNPDGASPGGGSDSTSDGTESASTTGGPSTEGEASNSSPTSSPTSSVDDSTSAPSTGDDSTADAGTTEGSPLCGNGELEGDETCDDSDMIDGNGCNNDCQPSGRLLWLATFGDLDEDSGNGIVVDDAGDIYAVGTIFRAGIDDDVWLSRHSPDGAEAYSNLYDLAGNYERGEDIAWHSTNDRLYVVGSTNSSDFPELLWFETDGSLAAEGSTDPVNINPSAMAARGDDIYWVGSGSQNGLARLTGNGLDVDYSTTEAFPITGSFSPWLAVDVDASGAAVLAGSSSTQGYIERRLPAGGALDWRTNGLPPVRGLAVAPNGELVVTGSVSVPGEGQNAFVARFSADGDEELWTYDYNGDADLGDIGEAIAVHSSEQIVVAARSEQADNATAIAMIKLDADGNQLWLTIEQAEDGWSYPADVAVASDGAISVVGSFFDPDGGGDADIFVAHFAP
ncbi:MAG TPA: hypothetical protein VFG69_11225 [Nannocystaceae bacterium]|nr:hypothetical protein [Nannocystaceae bacterium]